MHLVDKLEGGFVFGGGVDLLLLVLESTDVREVGVAGE